MNFRVIILSLSIFAGFLLEVTSAKLPNVIVILADDLGYGDLGSYGAELINSPNLDRLASEGMRFTYAYTPSSVCSPTRYSLLTGRYFWRSPKHPQTRVLWPQHPLSLEEGRDTLATLFKKAGYRTGVVGKWHLGFGDGQTFNDWFDWDQYHIAPGPLERGFDSFYGLAANVGNQPRIFINNHSFEGRKPGDKVQLKNNALDIWEPSREWEDDSVAQRITDRAVQFINQHSGPDHPPFFLYFPTTPPHNPIAPAPSFQGRSPAGPYGDFVEELDAQIGQVILAAEAVREFRDTLIIFTSDNGAVAEVRGPPYKLMKKAGHRPNGKLRGGKWSIYEGGFRVPLIAWWPGKIQSGSINANMVSLVDIFATMSELLNSAVKPESGEDSISFLPQMLNGSQEGSARDHVVLQSTLGVRSIVLDEWKYMRPWTPSMLSSSHPFKNTERELNNPENFEQLYNLKNDPGEEINLIEKLPEVAIRLREALNRVESTHQIK